MMNLKVKKNQKKNQQLRHLLNKSKKHKKHRNKNQLNNQLLNKKRLKKSLLKLLNNQLVIKLNSLLKKLNNQKLNNQKLHNQKLNNQKLNSQKLHNQKLNSPRLILNKKLILKNSQQLKLLKSQLKVRLNKEGCRRLVKGMSQHLRNLSKIFLEMIKKIIKNKMF